MSEQLMQRVMIPFRDRGLDPRRRANLDVVMAWWWAQGFEPTMISDGLDGDAQFNRHRAYNRAVEKFPETDVFIFTEADMLIPVAQINEAVALAKQRTGLVVPFTEYRYLSDITTAEVRDLYHDQTSEFIAEWIESGTVFSYPPESVKTGGKSIGAVNVVSRETLRLTGGFTELTSGNWYDDRITEKGFAFMTNPTRWVGGPAVHMYHLPGWTGDHLTKADKEATEHNRQVLLTLIGYMNNKDRVAVHSLMSHRKGR